MTLELHDSPWGWETLRWQSLERRPVDSDAELVRRAQAGEIAAFEELYRSNVGRVYALCLRMSGDRSRAEDLTQDVFVRAWEKLGSFHGRSAFSSWLHRLAVNLVTSRWRGRQRRESRFLPVEDPESMESRGEGRSVASGIDLERSIAQLPPQARMVFVLFDIEGYKHREIAGLTGLSVGTSKAHLHRARRLLREALESSP